MPENEELRLTVSLVDNASAGIAGLRAQLGNLLSGSTAAQVERFRDSQKEMAKQVKELSEILVVGDRAMLGYIGKFGALGLATSAAMGFLKEGAERLAAIGRAATLAGTSAPEMKNLVDQFTALGVNASQSQPMLVSFAQRVAELGRVGSAAREELVQMSGSWGPQMDARIRQIISAKDETQALNLALDTGRTIRENVYNRVLAQHKGDMDMAAARELANKQAAAAEDLFFQKLGLNTEAMERQEGRFEEMTQAQKDAADEAIKRSKELEDSWNELNQTIVEVRDTLVLHFAPGATAVLHEFKSEVDDAAAAVDILSHNLLSLDRFKELMFGGGQDTTKPATPNVIQPGQPLPPNLQPGPGVEIKERTQPATVGEMWEKLKGLWGHQSTTAPQPGAMPEAPGLVPKPRQHGGPVSAGERYLVGERGPELFTPHGGGDITPFGADDHGRKVDANTDQLKRLNEYFARWETLIRSGLDGGGMPGMPGGPPLPGGPGGGGAFGGGGSSGGGGASGSYGGGGRGAGGGGGGDATATGASTGDPSVPSDVLAKAKQVALGGGPGAVQAFMAQQGYPKNGNWCGEFAASVVKSVGGTPPKNPEVASNWRNWGTPVEGAPQPGDVAVRKGAPTGQLGSHVTFVENYDPKTGTFTGIGGNQGRPESRFSAKGYDFRRSGLPNGSDVGPGSGPGAGTAPTGGAPPTNEAIAAERSRVMKQLQEPGMRELTAGVIAHEQEGEGGRADVLESLVNRAVVTGKHPRDLIKSGFYGPVNRGEIRGPTPAWALKDYDQAAAEVAAGRNALGGRVDQGMLNEVAAAGRARIRGEYYGWMGLRGEHQTAAARAAGMPDAPAHRNAFIEAARRDVDRGAGGIHRVEATGKLTANITAPAGTHVGVEGGGLFRHLQVNRQTQMRHAQAGPVTPGRDAFEE